MRHALARMLAATLLLAASAFAQAPDAVTESSVKAAFLYKFAGYVDWPPTEFARPDAPFVIGVLHASAIAAELEKLVPGRAVAGHPGAVRRLKSGDSLQGVHILFVGGYEPDRAAIRAGQEEGALVVTESAHGLDAGGAINFVVANERVSFEVSLEAAQRSGHHISARMLAVARRVVQKGT